MMQRRDFEWRIANALGSSSAGHGSMTWLQPTLLALSLIVLVVAPKGTAAQLTPIVGTLGLGIEFIYLLRLVFRMHFTLLSMDRQGQQSGQQSGVFNRRRSALRRSVLPAVNAMVGLLIFTLMFYPLSHAVIASATDESAGRLLWLLTVGAAIVALAFGQLVSLLLDAVQHEAAAPPQTGV